MNRIFRIIRSEYKQAGIIVAGKMKSCGFMPSSIVASAAFMAVLLCGALPAHALDPAALPTGGQIVAGSGSISQSGSNMTVNQNTSRMIANWDTFNIGQNAAVQFQQPGASSVALNRIIDQNPSQIFGRLSANGQIFLLNPSGIIFGQTARVDVGGIVASSLNLSNENFMAGKYLFEKAGTAGAILNQGSIRTANGSYVAFLSPQVQNEGDITANGGSVLMAAGDKVTLNFTGDGLLSYSVEQGAIDALAENSGLIKADGGMVVMTAKAVDALTSAVVNNTGTIEAQTLENRGGRILLLSDMEHGETIVSGTLDASAPNGGDGGFIETSAAKLSMGNGLLVHAGSAHGKGGLWLIDPYSYTIDATAAGYIKTVLDSGTSVTIDTTSSPTTLGSNSITGTSVADPAGDITVNSNISKAAGGETTLTLNAHRDININGAITSSGDSNILNLILNADSDRNSDGAIILTKDITTNGGFVKFGSDNTFLVGTAIGGSGLRTISTAGGAVSFYGDVLMGQSLTVNSGDGAVLFGGKVDSGNTYALSGSTYTDWNAAKTAAGTDDNHYLVTITSALENSLVRNTAAGNDVLIGGFADKTGNNYTWRWKTGPEGLMDSGNGMIFATSSNNGTEVSHTLTPVPGAYNNWTTGEPNGNNSQAMQIWYNGGKAQWDNVPVIDTIARHYVQEISGTSATLTANAGSGTVTFSGAVGGSKALASLNVTSTNDNGIAINGGAVTTTGLQTYAGNVTLGSASTVLTQTAANTDFTLQAGKSITNTSGADASLTIKTTGSINLGTLGTGSSISSASNKLNTVLWADSDNDDNGYIALYGAINTNGGHAWLGGGAQSDTKWNELTVGDGSAWGNGTQINGINLYNGSSISAGTGNVQLSGATAQPAVNPIGVEIDFGGVVGSAASITTSSGNIDIVGTSTGTGSNGAYGLLVHSGAVVASTGGGNVTLQGSGGNGASSGTNTNDGVAIVGAVLADSGAISLTGTKGSSGYGVSILTNGTVGYKDGTDVTASSSNISVTADTLSVAGTLQSSGTLAIAPRTSSTSIGIAGGAGTLQLPASYFSTNFTNGFSSITIGSANAGDITVGGAVTYNDPLTLKTAGNIALNSGASLTGTAGQNASLVLWADSDNSGSGYIFVHDGNTISTNGGDIVMAGGSDTNADGRPDGFATATATYSGVGIGRNGGATATTTINSNGGNIFIKGKSTAGSGGGMGINFSYGGTLDAGTGTLTMMGESSSYAGIELSAWLGSTLNTYLDINAGTVNISGISTTSSYQGLASSQLSSRYTRITAGTGGITLYGENTANTNKGVEISLNATTTNGGNISIETPGIFSFYNGDNAHSINAGSGNIGIKANTLNIGNSNTLAGSGTLTLEPYTAGRAINIGTTGALDIASGYFSSNFTNGFSGITVGNATAGNITVGGATTLNDSTTLWSNGAIAINGAVTASENFTLKSGGAISQTGALSVTGATSITAGANNITLSNTGNNFTGAVSVVSGKNVSIIDSNAMTLGAVTATGAVDIATLTGDLTLTGAVQTTDATANAIKLNAAKNTAVGTSTGGNIIVSGGTASPGAGGRATLFSGDIADTTLATLVSSGSGRFRYNSDETTDFSTGSWIALGTGTYAVYRKQPTLTVTPGSHTITYGDATPVFTNTNGTEYVNGDTTAGTITGTATWTVGGTKSTSNNYIAGNHDVSYASGLVSPLGYGFVDNAASSNELTVSKYNLSVTGLTASNKTYDTFRTATLGGTVAVTALAGDTVTLGGTAAGTFADKTAADNKAVTVTGNTISGDDSGNYTLLQQTGLTADISKADLSVTGLTASNKTYDATTAATLGGTAAITPLLTDDVTIGGTASGTFGNKNVGDGKVVTVTGNTLTGSNDDGNYNLVQQTGLTANITPAALSVTANNDEKKFSGIPYSGGNGVTYSGFVNSESTEVLGGVLDYGGNSQGAVNTGSYAIKPTGLTAGNYTLGFVDGSLTITELYNPVVQNVIASITSFQNHVNGTQDQTDNGRGMSNPAAAGMGPGAGIGIFEGNDFGGLISDRTGYLTDEERRNRF